MRKVFRKLTEDQKARQVIFSSTLSPSGTIHEVFSTDPQADQARKIALLKDDKFFNSSPYKFNLIRQ